MNWDGFAQVDPFWAICADPDRHGRSRHRWTQEEFFATGQTEIDRIMQYLQGLELSLDVTSAALDFGCGVGRLTRALSHCFHDCWGIDISPTMIRLAEQFNADRPGCHFCVNDTDNLHRFADATFGFAYTSIVLQHISPRYIARYLLELIRVLKGGGIFVFQVADQERISRSAKLRHTLAYRRWITQLLRRKNTTAFHMEMHCFPERDVRALLAGQPVRLVDVQLTNSGVASFNGDLRFLDEAPVQGFVSKQYCLVKAR
jgi:SAM-dependent methyltransferase